MSIMCILQTPKYPVTQTVGLSGNKEDCSGADGGEVLNLQLLTPFQRRCSVYSRDSVLIPLSFPSSYPCLKMFLFLFGNLFPNVVLKKKNKNTSKNSDNILDISLPTLWFWWPVSYLSGSPSMD